MMGCSAGLLSMGEGMAMLGLGVMERLIRIVDSKKDVKLIMVLEIVKNLALRGTQNASLISSLLVAAFAGL